MYKLLYGRPQFISSVCLQINQYKFNYVKRRKYSILVPEIVKGYSFHCETQLSRFYAFSVGKSLTMSHRQNSVNMSDLFAREIDIEVCLKTLKIYQKIEGDVSCVVWDASLVLAKYLETLCYKKADFLSGTKVLELGAGLGVVGLTAATLGAQVTLSDLPETLSLLRININENKTKISSMGGYAIAESLVWGDNSSDLLKEEFDLIVFADCVYYEEAIDPLLETLMVLNKSISKKPTIYITQELRDSDIQRRIWAAFYEKINDNFYIEQIPEEQQHTNYRSPDIVLLRLNKK